MRGVIRLSSFFTFKIMRQTKILRDIKRAIQNNPSIGTYRLYGKDYKTKAEFGNRVLELMASDDIDAIRLSYKMSWCLVFTIDYSDDYIKKVRDSNVAGMVTKYKSSEWDTQMAV